MAQRGRVQVGDSGKSRVAGESFKMRFIDIAGDGIGSCGGAHELLRFIEGHSLDDLFTLGIEPFTQLKGDRLADAVGFSAACDCLFGEQDLACFLGVTAPGELDRHMPQGGGIIFLDEKVGPVPVRGLIETGETQVAAEHRCFGVDVIGDVLALLQADIAEGGMEITVGLLCSLHKKVLETDGDGDGGTDHRRR